MGIDTEVLRALGYGLEFQGGTGAYRIRMSNYDHPYTRVLSVFDGVPPGVESDFGGFAKIEVHFDPKDENAKRIAQRCAERHGFELTHDGKFVTSVAKREHTDAVRACIGDYVSMISEVKRAAAKTADEVLSEAPGQE